MELKEFEKRLNCEKIKFKVTPNISREWIEKIKLKI